MEKDKVFIILLLVTSYWFLMQAFNVLPGTILKAALTSLLWCAALLCVHNYWAKYNIIKYKFNRIGLSLLNIILILNILNIFRSVAIDSTVQLTTALGNPFTALALLSPFIIGFAVNVRNLFVINKSLILIVFTGVSLALLDFLINGIGVTRETVGASWHLIYPMVFLIGSISYLKFHHRYAIIAVSILLFVYIGAIIGSRATFLRIFLLQFFNLIVFSQRSFIVKRVLPLTLLVVFSLPMLFIFSSLSGNESVFQSGVLYIQQVIGNSTDVNPLNKADTRTFLYFEVINDLIKDGKLLFGKGSSGTYFSEYFSITGHDSDTRLTVEVGFLALLLKGGLVAAISNVLLFIYAAVNAIYKSKNRYLRWIGFMLLVHVLLLFVENLVSFDLYNLLTWFFVGACLSREFLSMNDFQIGLLLNKGSVRARTFSYSNLSI